MLHRPHLCLPPNPWERLSELLRVPVWWSGHNSIPAHHHNDTAALSQAAEFIFSDLMALNSHLCCLDLCAFLVGVHQGGGLRVVPAFKHVCCLNSERWGKGRRKRWGAKPTQTKWMEEKRRNVGKEKQRWKVQNSPTCWYSPFNKASASSADRHWAALLEQHREGRPSDVKIKSLLIQL